jgi:hypothetical protein
MMKGRESLRSDISVISLYILPVCIGSLVSVSNPASPAFQTNLKGRTPVETWQLASRRGTCTPVGFLVPAIPWWRD